MIGDVRNTCLDIWQNAAARPAQAVVPVLVASLGMAALTFLLSGLSGLRHRANAMLQDFGVNVFEICAAPLEQSRSEGKGLTAADLRALSANLEKCAVSPVFRTMERIEGVGQVEVVGTDHKYPRWGKGAPVSGRLFDRMDVLRARRCAVVSASLASRLGLEPGRTLLMGGAPFDVAGIVAGRSGVVDGKEMANLRVWIPYTTAMFWLGGRDWESEMLDSILVAVQDGQNMESSVISSRRLLEQNRNSQRELIFVTPDVLLKEVRSARKSLVAFAGGAAVVGLGLGSVVLAILMMANVRSRVAEIGLRRSLGATSRDILELFICEGCVSGLVAALIGVAIGFAITAMVGEAYPMPLRFKTHVALAPILLGILLGGCSAWVPARLAAGIPPAESLRWE